MGMPGKDRWFRIPVPTVGELMIWGRVELRSMIDPCFKWFIRDFDSLEIVLILDPEVVHGMGH